jgi:uncharacterized membrane protein YfcA
MARSHHRKKHKEHLRQFKHSHDTISTKTKGKASTTFLIVGTITGFAISYFAQGTPLWLAAGFVVGGLAGYFIGRRIDKGR